MAFDEGDSAGPRSRYRRRFLRGVGATGIGGVLAGCLGDGGDDEEDDDAPGTDEPADDSDDNGEDNGEEGPTYTPPPEERWPERVEPGAEGLGPEPPADATILWDGDEVTLDQWEHTWSPTAQEPVGADPVWEETDEYFEAVPDTGDIRPEIDGIGAGMGDCHLHVEFMQPEGIGDSGNSGLFMMERYEIQILAHTDGTPQHQVGTYYNDAWPHAQPLRPRGEWNEYDVFWRAPVFDDDGELLRLPQLTLFFNGVATNVHYDVVGPNWGGINPFDHEELGHPVDDEGNFVEEYPIFLQEHGAVVRFRNVWYRDLPERPFEVHEHPDQIPEYDTSQGDDEDPPEIDPGGPGTTGEPPADAEVLFDDELTIEPGDDDWVSDDEYGDCQLHLEWRVPKDVEAVGPDRGGSGVLLMGDYEISIVDNYDNPTEAEEWAGAYPGQTGPHHDAVRESGEWQQFDVLWQGPRFEDGELALPARVSAFLNGVPAQLRLEVDGPNGDGTVDEYEHHAPKGPIHLREGSSTVQFRNTWVRPFD